MTGRGLDVLGGPVLEVAPLLLGARFTHAGVTVRITEVEAYGGAEDPGSHAYRGRTPRTAVMFGPPGRLYVYLVYGMHHCANVSADGEGTPAAVLLRGAAVVDGIPLARARRPGSGDRDLARGPARLCRALDVDREQDGADLGADVGAGAGSGPTLRLGPAPTVDRVRRGPRVGLRSAGDRPWRYWLADEPSVSAHRPAAPRFGPPRPGC